MSDAHAGLIRILIDENLSPRAALELAAAGVDAIHVRDRGLSGVKDHELLEFAFREDRILITVNVEDFEKFASQRELHAGIVLVLDGELFRHEQVAVIQKAVNAISAEMAEGRDMVNRSLRVSIDCTTEFSEVSRRDPEPDP